MLLYNLIFKKMTKVLNVYLKKNKNSQKSHEYCAEIIQKGNMNIENIIDELLKDGTTINRTMALDIINLFNQKVADLVLTGINVNTGLVNLKPLINGILFDKKWNPEINNISINITESSEFQHYIAQTSIEFEEQQVIQKTNMENKHFAAIQDFNGNNTVNSEIPNVDNAACGIAFRNWLLKA